MKLTDYKTLDQANNYLYSRFSNGLEVVNQDEYKVLSDWMKKIKLRNEFVAVDLGSGTGRIIKILLQQNPKKIYAVDSSKAMLKILSTQYRKEVRERKVQILIGKTDSFSLMPSTIDLITAIHIFKHLPNIKPTLQQAYKVLKKGGYMIFEVINQDSLINFKKGTCYTTKLKFLKRELSDNKLEVLEFRNIHYFGESTYKFAGQWLSTPIRFIDNILSKYNLPFGTKIFILARKK